MIVERLDRLATLWAEVALRAEFVPQALVNESLHLGHEPLDDVAERLVVDVEVLTADRALCALLEFVLPVSV